MSARFPPPSSARALPADAKELSAILSRTPPDVLRDGWVRLHGFDAEHFLFLVQGKAHGAGRLEAGDRFGPIPFAGFFEACRNSKGAELCASDLPLLLCMEVLFRKAPAAQIPSNLLNGTDLLSAVQQTGKDAVLVIRREDARSLVFCRSGEPIALYPAEGEEFPEVGNVSDRVIEYVLAHRSLTLDLYDEIRIPAAPGAGKPFESYVQEVAARPAAAPAQPTHTLVVRLGTRVVFRFPLATDAVTIGRGEDNDVVLDNPTVSRKHAVLRKEGTAWVMEDQGSENQLEVGGTRKKRVDLTPGLEVSVGRYTLLVSRYAAGDENVRQPRPSNPAIKAMAAEETIFMAARPGDVASIEHQGRAMPIRGIFFDIGKAPGAHLKIGGLFVAPIHVRISREKDGSHKIEHLSGLRALVVNGKKVVETILKHGDEFSIAGQKMRFVQPSAAGSAARIGPR